jgi:hypothetical protein
MASVADVRGRIRIQRLLWSTGAPSSFRYDRRLTKATISNPPSPFRGEATFIRGLPKASRWTGSLAASVPGRPNVAFTGTGFDVDFWAFHY